MFSNKCLAVLSIFSCLAAYSHAVVVTVDGVGSAPDTYAKLSDAISYTNLQGSGPHTINITVDELNQADIQATVNTALTINGDADANGIPVKILVDVATLKTATDIGVAGRAYLEIQTEGNVIINDVVIYPNANGSSVTGQTVDGIITAKPVSGIGNYTFNNVTVTGAINNAPANLALTVSQYYASGTKFYWYGYLAGSGAFTISNKGGDGTYNTTLNNCKAGLARSTALNVFNQSGDTHINGGIFGHSGEDGIRVNGSQNTYIDGTATHRVRVVNSNNAAGGHGIRVTNSAILKSLTYTDIYSVFWGNAASDRNGIRLDTTGNNNVEQIKYVRVGETFGYPLYVPNNNTNANINIENSTFHAPTMVQTGQTAVPTVNPIEVQAGLVTIKDSIFTSYNLGQISAIDSTFLPNVTYSAVPTDGQDKESLNTSTPFVNAPVSTSNIINLSPLYTKVKMDNTLDYDPDFLRPTNSAYATASSISGMLLGGAGPDTASVNDWTVY